MLVVLDEGDLPGDRLLRRIDLDRTGEAANRPQHIPGHIADGAVGSQRDPASAAIALLDHGLVRAHFQGDDEGTCPIRRGEGRGLPPPHRELAEHLRVGLGVSQVFGPPVVGRRRPEPGHRRHLGDPGHPRCDSSWRTSTSRDRGLPSRPARRTARTVQEAGEHGMCAAPLLRHLGKCAENRGPRCPLIRLA